MGSEGRGSRFEGMECGSCFRCCGPPGGVGCMMGVGSRCVSCGGLLAFDEAAGVVCGVSEGGGVGAGAG